MNDNTTTTTTTTNTNTTNTTNNNTSNNDFDGNELSNHDDNENNTIIPEITKVYTPKDVYDIVRNDRDINELILALHQGENHINW